jgi:hypothetical protein
MQLMRWDPLDLLGAADLLAVVKVVVDYMCSSVLMKKPIILVESFYG